jgi:hypothetical protein
LSGLLHDRGEVGLNRALAACQFAFAGALCGEVDTGRGRGGFGLGGCACGAE